MFLGIDVGTSSVKTVLVDDAGIVAAESSASLDVSRPAPSFSEQDPDAWWQGTAASIRALPDAMRRRVQAIGLTGQMHGATVLDAADHPLRPAILWNDGRSAAECAEIEAIEPNARRITGNIVMPGFTAPKLLWLSKHEPEVFRRIAHVLLPKDYVRLRLTGERITDMSDASGTAWLDVGRRAWSDEMLAATGLSRRHMPSLAEGNAPAGRLTPAAAELLGLPRAMVAAGAGDNAASAIGMGIVAPGEAFLSLGTSGVLFVATDGFRPNPMEATHAFCHALPQRWHQMAVILTAASALDWVVRLTGSTGAFELVAAAEARGLRRDTPLFLPYLSGERTPHNDPHSRGVFFGLNNETTPADMAVAVLEGVAFALADGLDVLGGKIGTISMTGGGARFPYWGSLIAAALQYPVTYREAGAIGAAYGAARLARMALTHESPEAICLPPRAVDIIEPKPELSALLAERRVIFRRLYPDLKPAFRQFEQ